MGRGEDRLVHLTDANNAIFLHRFERPPRLQRVSRDRNKFSSPIRRLHPLRAEIFEFYNIQDVSRKA